MYVFLILCCLSVNFSLFHCHEEGRIYRPPWTPPRRCERHSEQAVQSDQHSDYGNYTAYPIVPVAPISAFRWYFADSNTNIVQVHTAFDCKVKISSQLVAWRKCTGEDKCILKTKEPLATYKPIAGYKWDAKVSDKSDKIEVGGVTALSEEEYNCTHRTEKCEAPAGVRGKLLMYYEQTDVECTFGNITLENKDVRNGETQKFVARSNFTEGEIAGIIDSALVAFENERCQGYTRFVHCNGYMIDVNKIPTKLMEKLMSFFPDYNPTTDIMWLGQEYPDVWIRYIKITNYNPQMTATIPLSNKDGESVSHQECFFQIEK